MPASPKSKSASRPLRVADYATAIPRDCYENPNWKGIVFFAADLIVYAGSLVVLATGDSLPAIAIGWIVAGCAISALFVIGHDAAHGALFKSKRLSYLVGQAAMLPSLHGLALWSHGHTRHHHTFAVCQGLDFVWHPVTREEFARLSGLGKLRHRLEWSAIGAGFYYARVIWWNRMVRGEAPARDKKAIQRDRAVVAVFFTIFSSICLLLGWSAYGTTAGMAWMWIKVALVPWLLWNAIIGWVVYVQHINPAIAWLPRSKWTKVRGQIDGTKTFEMPRLINAMWHNIFDHSAHHIDPRIPFYNLPRATRALKKAHPNKIRPERYRIRTYVAITKSCKLFDFDNGVWLDYQGNPAPVV